MAKEKFERGKPHCNIGTIGHVDHGKTTLTLMPCQTTATPAAGSISSVAAWPYSTATMTLCRISSWLAATARPA